MTSENNIFDFISDHEGIRKDIYLDHKGIPTIGVGYNLKNADVLTLLVGKFGYSEEALKRSDYKELESKLSKVVNESEWNKSTLDANTKKINDILKKYKDKNTDPELKAKAKDTFSFSEFGDTDAAKAAMKLIFETAMQDYER